MLTAAVTVRRRVGPCALVLLKFRLRAAGSPGDVSGDADAVVVPVDVSCAPSDGSLSYRVCVWAWKKCSAAGAEAQCENYTFSGFDVRMHGRNGELGAVCHVANAVHKCSNCAASCARKEEETTVAFTMNVMAHKYAGPYELWWRLFPPMEPSIRLHGAAMLTVRASVSCRHPVKGGMTQNLARQLHRN
ncbi:mucin-like glycoprotein [Trypanosoma cruzi]|nr:mucin-like glycoprotein [Trypanosoma cruzi]